MKQLELSKVISDWEGSQIVIKYLGIINTYQDCLVIFVIPR